MNFDDLRLFAIVARLESYAQASEETGVARSTLTRAIQRLEIETGVQLLNRTTRKVSLTSYGQLLLGQVEPSIQSIKEAVRDTRFMAGEPAGLLRISAPSDVLDWLLIPVVQRMVKAYPHIELDIALTLKWIDLVSTQVDAALRFYAEPPRDEPIFGQPLVDSLIGWYASPNYLQEHGTPQSQTDLQHHTLIAPPRAYPKAKAKILLEESVSRLSMTLAGVGIGALTDHLARKDVAQGRLVRLTAVESIPVQLWIIYPTTKVSPAVSTFSQALENRIAELVSKDTNHFTIPG